MNFNLKLIRFTFILGVFFLVTSCLNNVEEEIQEPVSDLCDNITFSVNVKPILDSNCIQCHSAGGNFPNLTDINIVIQNANRIKSEVVSREMPKNGSLTQEEIDIISCWVDAGAINN